MATSPHLQLFHRKAGAKVRLFFEIHKKKCKKMKKICVYEKNVVLLHAFSLKRQPC